MIKEAYFAGGCFWCIANVFYDIEGVKEVVSGYSGGNIDYPTYEEVRSQKTGHRESIKILYDEEKISYEDLLEIFYNNIDPFDDQGQFIDRGFSYSTAIFVKENQRVIALNFLKSKQKSVEKEIKISVEDFSKFFLAEEYHQLYSKKNPEKFEKELLERKEYIEKEKD